MPTDDLAFTTAVDLAAAVRARRLSPVEIVVAFLARIEAIDPTLDAGCAINSDEVRQAAGAAEEAVTRGDELGPLHGVPVAVKDVVFTRGMRTTRGSAIYADLVPDEDSPIVERLKRSGAIILGKTTTPEFGWKGVTDSPLLGITRNPWDVTRTPGGSSGGSAAALAAGLAPIAIGTDGAGSIRIPASFSGVVGLKPSFGRVPFHPPSAVELLSHAGPMARTVADAALLQGVIAGRDDRDPNSLPDEAGASIPATGDVRGLRVAWSADLGFVEVDSEVHTLTEAAARRFADDLGCAVEPVDPGFADPYEAEEVLFYGGIAAGLAPYLPEWRDRLDPGLVPWIDWAQDLTAVDFARATAGRRPAWEAMRRLFGQYDLLLTPTMPMPAFPLGTDSPLEASGQPARGLAWTPFTYPFNLTGLPAISIPCGFTSAGLPVGLQIVGPRWADNAVLRAAAAYEVIAPWNDRRPPIA